MELKPYVEVYSKSNEFLALFTNVPPDETSKKINMMVEPEIVNEQNLPSIFTFSIDTRSDKWQDIKEPENIYIVNGKHYTALNETAFRFDGNTVYVNLSELQTLLTKQYIQAYNTPKVRENIDEHTVVLLPKSKEPLKVNGVTVNNPHPRGSAAYNLYALLYPTEWNLGVCDVMVDGFSPSEDFGVFNIETDQKDIFHNINLVRELYGGILVWHSDKKILDLRDEIKWNNDDGFEIRQGKNLAKMPEISQNNDIITRLFPLGDNSLNIKAVNANKNYLDNFSYTNKIYTRIVNNPNIYDQKQLKFWGERQLEKMCKPQRLIKAQMVDRRMEKEFSHEIFDLNDIVTIVFKDAETGYETTEKQRIIRWQYKVFTPYNCTIDCGDKHKNIMEILKQVFKSSSNSDGIINDNGTISGDNININVNGDYVQFQVNTETDFIKAHAAIDMVSDQSQASITALTEFTNKEFSKTNTRITQVSNEFEAKIQSLTEYTNKEFVKTRTSITQLSNEFQSSIKSLTEYTNGEFKKTNTSITQLSNSTESSITSLTEYTNRELQYTSTRITQVSNNLGSRIETQARYIEANTDNIASVTLTANRNESSIRLKANTVYVDGELRAMNGIIASKATITNLNATNVNVSNLSSKITATERLVADKATIKSLTATDAKITNLISGATSFTKVGASTVYASTSVTSNSIIATGNLKLGDNYANWKEQTVIVGRVGTGQQALFIRYLGR